jgi:hypothetical protein
MPQVVYSRPQVWVAQALKKICGKRWDTKNVQRGDTGGELATSG